MYKILKDSKIIGITEDYPMLLDEYEVIEDTGLCEDYIQVDGEFVLKSDDKAVRLQKDNRIAELKQYLSDTDYIANKLIEAVDDAELQDLKEKYAEILRKRREARAEINQLEK